jgi:hypothetical protein
MQKMQKIHEGKPKKPPPKTKKGTPEFHEIMKNRPQVEKTKEILRTYWKGKEQSPSHVYKRIKATTETKAQKTIK